MLKEGLILKSVGSWYDIYENGIVHKGRLKGKFKLEDKKLTNPIAVGDRVYFRVDSKHENVAIIEEIKERKNYIIRKSAHKNNQTSIIASNIDELFLVVTFAYPETSLGFIDRYLVAAESFGIPVSIIVNKSDLFTENEHKYYSSFEALYTKLGYGVYKVSAELEIGIDIIKDRSRNKVVLFSGHSGVGKSTLLNKIFPSLNQKTRQISNFANKGVHTTTFAEMFNIEGNTFLIDTPGIKEFGLVEIKDYEISHFFPEMKSVIGECKFNTCLHVNEPNCKVLSKLEKGEISESRYKSYLSILKGEDNRK
jgi:ribosome biogenesis GTPase